MIYRSRKEARELSEADHEEPLATLRHLQGTVVLCGYDTESVGRSMRSIPQLRFSAMPQRQTILSPCRTYRYVLWREWIGGEGYAMFIGLNPSTADERVDDNTIRREVGYAKAWGYGALCKVNLFGYRATAPSDMLRAADPVGPDNDARLLELARGAGVVVAAWGIHGKHQDRDAVVRALLPGLHVLRLTKDGHPAHSLYLPKDLRPVPWLASPSAGGGGATSAAAPRRAR
jgi:hypothetical protein